MIDYKAVATGWVVKTKKKTANRYLLVLLDARLNTAVEFEQFARGHLLDFVTRDNSRSQSRVLNLDRDFHSAGVLAEGCRELFTQVGSSRSWIRHSTGGL